ncbi:MAG: hypothetical protein ACI8RZ_005771 [Myxococcota bacterium]|jgi:hypothetical protein
MRVLVVLCSVASACTEYKLESEETPAEDLTEEVSPDILVSPEAIDFGVLALDDEVTAVITIDNVGTDLLGITELSLSDDTAPLSFSAISSTLIAPGDRAEFSVTLYARESGEISAEVYIDSIDPDEPRVAVPLTASVPEPEEPFDTGTIEEPEDDCECPEEYVALPDDDGCIRQTEVEPTYEGEPAYVCPITPYFAYGMLGVRYPGGEALQSEYWGQNDSNSNGPLNRIGVWGCEKGDTVAGSNPVGEWIGFSVCLDLKKAGDYLLGAGSDNRMRLYIDGAKVFERDDGQTSSFNYWWLTGVSLQSGEHTAELHGYNDGSIAGFGAEIVGPFPSGSLSADDDVVMKLDYEGNIAWSTADAIGQAFELGEDSGWTCPDGSFFDACAEKPVCIILEEAECQ